MVESSEQIMQSLTNSIYVFSQCLTTSLRHFVDGNNWIERGNDNGRNKVASAQGQLSDIIENPRRALARKLAALGSVRVELLHMLHLPTLWTRVIPDYEEHTARTKMVRVLHDGEFITIPLMDHYERHYEYTLEYPDLPLVRLESYRTTAEAFPMEMILLV
ncbi:hypothetical protein GCK72_015677 [Caenorhabditis remanei]|uniref:PAZ domain-containing protein n=1 Tax=Caenorhabditis remanei TaxID=31234 RepID=A0A6A5GX70_CAERE|nr:hypothetical protein GCK72_015677 [Caenorhabditis remanei]KAF1759216.1 hypothetical protein GCK72_015677 [Caenorhabditis remanei]